MAKTLSDTRQEMSDYAPRILSIKIKTDKIRDVIGLAAKSSKTSWHDRCQIDIEEDGTVKIFSSDGEAGRRALKIVEDLTQEPEVGKLYLGTVRKTTDFGAFIEIFPEPKDSATSLNWLIAA